MLKLHGQPLPLRPAVETPPAVEVDIPSGAYSIRAVRMAEYHASPPADDGTVWFEVDGIAVGIGVVEHDASPALRLVS